MPFVRSIQIDHGTKLGVWKISEQEAFFRTKISIEPQIHHRHKRLQHFAARYLLVELFPDFPIQEIRVKDSRKPYLEQDHYHFSLSHCGDYAASIVSMQYKVGIDVEQVTPKVQQVVHKFLSEEEQQFIDPQQRLVHQTVCWCAKEALYKWHGEGGVDFKQHLQLQPFVLQKIGMIDSFFIRDTFRKQLTLHYLVEEAYVLAWVVDAPSFTL